MANQYDKIFKENIEEIVMPLAERLLHLALPLLEEVPDDIQSTKERRPDFLKIVRHDDPQEDFILHIEFQSTNDADMLGRMLEYRAMLRRKFGLQVTQALFYIGDDKMTMTNNLSEVDLIYSYKIISLTNIDYHTFIKSERPEEVVLAILGNFERAFAEEVVKEIINRIKELASGQLRLYKYATQLDVLSKLRNLQSITSKLVDIMITYDLETDVRYLQGIAKERENSMKIVAKAEAERAKAEAERAKAEAERKNTICKLHQSGKFTTAQIAELLELDLDYINEAIGLK